MMQKKNERRIKFWSADSSAIFLSPREEDILVGRGGKTSFLHEGNIGLRAMIAENVDDFARAPTREEKTKIVRSIMHFVLDRGGRFLKKDSHKSPNWYLAGFNDARNKISHALRDAAADKVKCMVAMKQKQTFAEQEPGQPGRASYILSQPPIRIVERKQKPILGVAVEVAVSAPTVSFNAVSQDASAARFCASEEAQPLTTQPLGAPTQQDSPNRQSYDAEPQEHHMQLSSNSGGDDLRLRPSGTSPHQLLRVRSSSSTCDQLLSSATSSMKTVDDGSAKPNLRYQQIIPERRGSLDSTDSQVLDLYNDVSFNELPAAASTSAKEGEISESQNIDKFLSKV